jgi:hypothetical protein
MSQLLLFKLNIFYSKKKEKKHMRTHTHKINKDRIQLLLNEPEVIFENTLRLLTLMKDKVLNNRELR